MKKLIILGVLTIVFACQGNKSSNTTTNTPTEDASTVATVNEVLSLDAFLQKIQSDENVQILDVRTATEFEAGSIPNAMNINVLTEDFTEAVANRLDKDKPVMVYCKVGGRSARAAKILEGLGFQEIYDLEGGYLNYKNSN